MALALARGTSLRAIAAQGGVSYETVRVHLRRTLAKSGTHKQSELVSLILNGLGATLR